MQLETELAIEKHLKDMETEITEPLDKKSKVLQNHIDECDSIINNVPDRRQYIENQGSSDGLDELIHAAGIAELDKAVYQDMLTEVKQDIHTINKTYSTYSATITREINHLLQIKASLLQAQGAGEYVGRHERLFAAQMKQLDKALDAAEIPKDLIEPLKVDLRKVPTYSINEVA